MDPPPFSLSFWPCRSCAHIQTHTHTHTISTHTRTTPPNSPLLSLTPPLFFPLLEIALCLLSHGADPLVTNESQAQPIHYLCRNPVAISKQDEYLELLHEVTYITTLFMQPHAIIRTETNICHQLLLTPPFLSSFPFPSSLPQNQE